MLEFLLFLCQHTNKMAANPWHHRFSALLQPILEYTICLFLSKVDRLTMSINMEEDF